jgi:hypothetical protein
MPEIPDQQLAKRDICYRIDANNGGSVGRCRKPIDDAIVFRVRYLAPPIAQVDLLLTATGQRVIDERPARALVMTPLRERRPLRARHKLPQLLEFQSFTPALVQQNRRETDAKTVEMQGEMSNGRYRI